MASRKPAKEAFSVYTEQISLYNQLITAFPGIEPKGAALPYTSFNGHMLSFLSAEGTLAIRLPQEERTLFLKKYNTSLMEAHGTIMKEYVAVPASLLPDTPELKPWLEKSYAYIQSLKPKATKKAGS